MSTPRLLRTDAVAGEPNDADRISDLMVLLLLGCLGGLVGQPVGLRFRSLNWGIRRKAQKPLLSRV